MKILRTGMALLAGTLMLPGIVAAAGQQPGQQQPSLGEIARRLREKKKEAPKPAHVWDNDNIPTTPGAVSVVGMPSPPTLAKGEADAGNTPATAKEKEADQLKDIADTQAALLEAKTDLQNLQSDLDLMSRQLLLDQQQYYGKPDYVSDRADKAKLDIETAQVAAKRQDIVTAQAKIDDLQSRLDNLKAAPAQSAEQPEAAPSAPPAESPAPAPAPAPAPPSPPEPPPSDSGPPPPADSSPPPPAAA